MYEENTLSPSLNSHIVQFYNLFSKQLRIVSNSDELQSFLAQARSFSS